MAHGFAVMQPRQLEMAIALQQAALGAVMRLDSELHIAMMSGHALPSCSVSPSRLFPGTGDQVRAVRDYARAGFVGHGARDDAVLVASELATNAIEHSASGRSGGMFMVYLAELGAYHVAMIVTDQGGPSRPHEEQAAEDAESGRGLAVAKSLTSLLEFSEDGELRSALAIIPDRTVATAANPWPHARR
jgi:serine/threonine-protein kinase RsbW